MTTLPAVVTIVDLTPATTLLSSAMFEAVQTTNGQVESVSVLLSQIATTGFGALPTGGATGTLLYKTSGTNYAAGWEAASSFLSANSTSGLTISGSTSLAAALTSFAGPAVLGVAGTAVAIPLALTGATAQIFGVVSNTAGFFPATTLMPGPFQTASLTQSAVVIGAGAGALGTIANATTNYVLTSNGTVLAPSFLPAVPATFVVDLSSATAVTGVLPVAFGGIGTAALLLRGVLLGGSTATGAISAAAVSTAGNILIDQGTAANPAFKLVGQDLLMSSTGSATVAGLYGRALLSTVPTTAQLISWNGTSWAPASRFEAVNAQSGTTYTIQDTDLAKLITLSNASAIAVTLPQAGTASIFQSGWYCDIRNKSTAIAGIATITLRRLQQLMVVQLWSSAPVNRRERSVTVQIIK